MRKRKLLRITIAICLMAAMVFSNASFSFAESKLDKMLAETEGLEEYLRTLTYDMTKLVLEQENLQTMIDDVQVKIDENEILLADTQVACDEQYEAMKLRIKFLYETNDVDYLEALLSAQSVADIVNKFSYIKSIVEYDRNMLDKYDELTTAVTELQTGLEEKKAELEEYQAEVKKNIEEAQKKANQATSDIADMGVDKTDIPDIIEEYEDEYGDDIYDEVIRDQETEPSDDDEDSWVPDEPDNQGEQPSEEPSNSYEEPTSPSEEPGGQDEEPSEEPVTIPTETSTEYVEITTTPAYEEPSEEPTDSSEEPTDSYEEPDYDEPDYSDGSNDPLWDVARVTYLENGCMYPTSSYRSIYLTACVILNRAYNWYGGSISAAIYDSGQYATAYKYDNWGGGPLTINDITWTAVYDAYYNLDPNPYYQANGDWLDDMGLTLYYRDPVTDEVFYYAY